ncbi:MAG: hypothetical protein P4L41_16790, partial [Flavipsychrobacter sp.]|nr:hypothetical protein [Flavipsychrobacter sp.]
MKNNKMLLLLTFAGLIAMQQTHAEWNDVTAKVRSFNDKGKEFEVKKDNFGDPAIMIPKKLEITTEINKIVADENKQVPVISGEVTKATYGAGDKKKDVTDKVKEFVLAGNNFRVDNDTLGGDPAPGETKTLEITLPTGAKKVVIDENQIILVGNIDKATYGSGDRKKDVTDIVKKLVRAGKSFKVDNDTLGGDPAPGKSKNLEITLTKGAAMKTDYPEGSIVPGDKNRKVISARYGADGP